MTDVTTASEPPVTTPAAVVAHPAPQPAAPAPAPTAAPTPTIATGAEPKVEEVKGYWPEDWREKVAEHASAGDKKAYEKELRRLQNIENPASVYGQYRTMENTWASRNFIQKPGKEAKPEEVAKFYKDLGVPETPDGYFQDLKLDNGAVLGDADKPVAQSFAAALHPAGATPQVVNAALNWYLANQEKAAADLDASDDSFKREALTTLKEEFGPSFKRKTNAIASLFDVAPGGIDIKNEAALYSRLMGGRMADGKIIGDDPDMVKFLVALAMDRNPQASVVEDGDQTGRSVADEIASIEKRMREDRNGYFKDNAMQARYVELIGARERMQARKAS
jgi:hypothetical protein